MISASWLEHTVGQSMIVCIFLALLCLIASCKDCIDAWWVSKGMLNIQIIIQNMSKINRSISVSWRDVVNIKKKKPKPCVIHGAYIKKTSLVSEQLEVHGLSL